MGSSGVQWGVSEVEHDLVGFRWHACQLPMPCLDVSGDFCKAATECADTSKC